jgi:predicted metalloprotease with PDZ domain
MSKTLKPIYYFVFTFALILQIFNNSPAQTVQVKIKMTDSSVAVEGSLKDAGGAQNVTNLSFLKSYTNIENLGARISDVNLFDKNGQNVNYKKLADGEFWADSGFAAWSYRADLSVSKNSSAMAHVSWISDERGILMLGDLLPEFAGNPPAIVRFELPKDWRISSAEERTGENVFIAGNVEKAVFYIGKNWREREIAAGSAQINLIISGEWQISDDEAASAAREIFAYYENLFGGKSFKRAQIFLGKFPPEMKTGRWEAETRGASVTIFSSELDFKTQSLQRLHEQLRHEIFHLWLPNGVNLAGNYDWFYEGFALYVSLKTAVAMNRIRFDDFLDTLARAHSIDTLQSQRASLIEASKNRWNGANTQVYARGMLVAFLIDVALLQKSKGKISLADVLREIYRKHGLTAERQDANAAILNVFRAHQEIQPIVEKYVKGKEDIAWQTDLDAVGIESATENFATKLKVKAALNGRQKDLLDKLGYNNWRKRAESSK